MKKQIKEIIKHRPIPKAKSHDKHHIPRSTEIAYILGGLLILVGIVCLFLTHQLYHYLPIVLSVILVAMGIVDIIRGFHTGEYKRRDTKLTSDGFVLILIGVIMLCFQDKSYMMIGAIWGTIGLLQGSEALNKTICSIADKTPFVRELLTAVVELTLAILLLLEPGGDLHHHLILLGLELVETGILYIIAVHRTDEEE